LSKILLVTSNFPPVVGGIGRMLQDVCEAAPPNDLVVLAPWGTGYSKHEAYSAATRDAAREFDSRQKYRVVRAQYSVRSRWRTVVSVAWFGLLTLALKIREKPALVYFGQTYPMGLIGLMVRSMGTPYVVHTYGSELLRPRSRLAQWLHRLVLERAFRVIAISEWGKRTLAEIGVPPERVVIIHPKVDMGRFQPPEGLQEFKEREGLAGKLVILTVSRLISRKGQGLVIQALPEILAGFPDTVYVVAGAGPDEENLKRLATEHRVSEKVKFVGYRDIVRFYFASDLFVLPSIYVPQTAGGDVEGFGIVYLEAGACGKPAIGSNNGGIPDAVADGESGLLVETGSVEAIAKAIKRLLGDRDLRERLGRQGYERVKREFTADRYWPEIEALLLAPLAGEKGRDRNHA
jgi:phosphatidylinositol alpha-1,6-mannosyltransferase